MSIILDVYTTFENRSVKSGTNLCSYSLDYFDRISYFPFPFWTFLATGLIFTIKIPTSTVFRSRLYKFEIIRQGMSIILDTLVQIGWIKTDSLFKLKNDCSNLLLMRLFED